MNMAANITTKTPMPAAIDDIYGEVNALVHQLHFLMHELEFAFDPKRGQPKGTAGVVFQFTNSSIDATLWLTCETWCRATDLQSRVSNLQAALDAEEAAAEKEALR